MHDHNNPQYSGSQAEPVHARARQQYLQPGAFADPGQRRCSRQCRSKGWQEWHQGSPVREESGTWMRQPLSSRLCENVAERPKPSSSSSPPPPPHARSPRNSLNILFLFLFLFLFLYLLFSISIFVPISISITITISFFFVPAPRWMAAAL